MSKIKIDDKLLSVYLKALEIEIKEIADEIKKIENIRDEMINVWKGQSAIEYLERFNNEIKSLKKVGVLLIDYYEYVGDINKYVLNIDNEQGSKLINLLSIISKGMVNKLF